jgi:hypothetical protein
MQVLRLCSGMRYMSLSFHSEEAIQEAVAFLRKVGLAPCVSGVGSSR